MQGASVMTGRSEALGIDRLTTRRLPTSFAVAGGLLGALGASSCCVLPLVLFTLGISGAWISILTALAPYQPLFVVAALGFLALGFLRVYRRPKMLCAEGSYCDRPTSVRLTKVGLWAATSLVAVAVAFPYVARLFLET